MAKWMTILLLLLPAIISADHNQTRESRDSYLDAYKDSHSSGSTSSFGEPPQKIQQPSPSYSPVYAKPASTYLPSQTPKPTYLPAQTPKPSNSYLPSKPSPQYGAPIPQYLKPSPGNLEVTDNYGYADTKHPMSKPMYGIPHFHHHYQIPEAEPETDVADKGHGGFDLKTVLKFLLKIVILKKIVKLIYIVMYFLFMPKFSLLETIASFFKDKDTEKEKPDSAEDKPDDDDSSDDLDDEDDDSFFRSGKNINHLNLLTNQVAAALENHKQS